LPSWASQRLVGDLTKFALVCNFSDSRNSSSFALSAAVVVSIDGEVMVRCRTPSSPAVDARATRAFVTVANLRLGIKSEAAVFVYDKPGYLLTTRPGRGPIHGHTSLALEGGPYPRSAN
jgi:hypothetical protein